MVLPAGMWEVLAVGAVESVAGSGRDFSTLEFLPLERKVSSEALLGQP